MKKMMLFILTALIISCQLQTDKSASKASLDKQFDAGSGIEMPELSPTLVNDLELLGKVWGFLKYHHPEIAKGTYNWDYELFRFLPGYLNDSGDINREEILLNWIDNFGEVEECEILRQTPEDAFLKPDLEWIKTSISSELLQNKLLYIYNNRNQGKNYYIKMAMSVRNPVFQNENPYSEMAFPDDGFRVLSLFRYWNIINYFFPYKHLIDKDWSNTLKEYIPVFINAQNALEYEFAAIQIIGDISDTHANLRRENSKIAEWKGDNYAPVQTRFIEDKLVVTDYYNPELKIYAGLEIGDIITKIEGKNVEDIISDLSKYYPASNQSARLNYMSLDMLRSQKTELAIEYLTGGVVKSKTLKLYPKESLNIYYWYKVSDEKCYKLLNDNIGYVTLASIKKADVSKIQKEFMHTKGIIIDIRNYPSTFVPFTLGSFFVSSSRPFVKFTSGNVKNPGEFTFTKEIKVPESKKPYKGKLIVLVNEFSVSQSEYTAMAFTAGDNTTIVGSTTAGADGNVSEIFLPGGLRTRISGIGVYYPNGEETQRVGIIPDNEVKPTIEGIKNGRDEVLEKAIELIMNE